MRRNELQITPNVSGNDPTTSLKHFGSRQKFRDFCSKTRSKNAWEPSFSTSGKLSGQGYLLPLPEKRKISKICVNRFYGAKWIGAYETLGDLVELHRFWEKSVVGKYFLEFFPKKKKKNYNPVYLRYTAITRATI
jgi:hypothetical protein